MTVAATTKEPEIVHEALDERQFVRTRFPAKATLHSQDGDIHCLVVDLSLGGMGLEADSRLLKGSVYFAQVSFQLKDMALSIEGSVKVVAQRTDTTGVEFVDLSPGQRDVLRHIVSAYLSGELVQTNGIFTVMQRENSIRQRKQKPDNTRSSGERLQALGGTLIYLMLGLVVLALVLQQLYLFLFRTEAVSALVQGNVFEINMPENGMVSFLLPPDQQQVARGDAVAVVSTRLMASMNTPADLEALGRLSDEDTRTLLGRSMIETVISSPCDCLVIYPSAAQDRYGYKDESLVHLLPLESPLHVEAQFPFDAVGRLRGDERVTMSVFGVPEEIGGRITRSTVDPATGNLQLEILPEQPLPLSAYQSPVRVQMFRSMPTPTLLAKLGE